MHKNNTSFLSLLFVSLCLTGCSTIEVASLATMVFTGKGFGDHALSTVTGQDCNFFNIVQGERVCYYNNSAEMMLLTSNQTIDDSLKVGYSEDNTGESNIFNSYLVIGSFSEQSRAESYQSAYTQWNSRVIISDQLADAKYRVVVGPVESQDSDSMKKALANEGIDSPWLITL